MTASTLRPDVVAFVAAVRTHLDDLDVAEVEELTGGLAADLTDAALDHVGPLEPRFGPPQAYADELRSAAGLAARRTRRRWATMEELHAGVVDIKAGLRAHPRWPVVEPYVELLRPVWWVMRAVVAAWLLAALLGGTGGIGWLLGLVFIAVSIELGRGRWSGRRGLAPLVLLGNVLAAVLVVPMLAGAFGTRSVSYDVATSEQYQPGLSQDGQPVTNVFAFDAQGRPLRDVQLFDQSGHPLNVDVDVATTFDGMNQVAPAEASDVYGRRLLNVYPLSQQTVVMGDDEQGTEPTTAAPVPALPPLVAVPPLQPTTAPTTQPTTVPTSVPTSGATTAVPRGGVTR